MIRLTLCLLLLTATLSGQHEVRVTNPPPATDVHLPLHPSAAEGITFMEPPGVDPLGAATTQLNLKLPEGRRGLQPELSFDYHHEQTTGWMGRGWDLRLPRITVETRWGVPRYATDTETETYLLNGQMLSPVAHRGGNRPRTANLRLYERIEGQFNRITRHGDSPRNYWFEVERADGSVDYYGGRTNGGMQAEATLGAPGGNIAAWYLLATVDAYGNRIDYHYATVSDPGIPGSSEPGTNVYPTYLTYTGFAGEEGPFRVDFIRDRELGEARRPDVEMDANLGFKVTTADLLRRVEISFRGEAVRTYVLSYEVGVFDKTLLTDIVELDRDGEEFYRHSFDYYDDALVDGRLQPYGPAEEWNTGRDNLTGPMLNPLPQFPNEVSALGSSTATNTQIGTAITFGPLGSPVTKDYTVGGSVGFGNSRSEGALALIDINGDLLPDKVFRRSGRLQYRANDGAGGFGDVRTITGIGDFSITTTKEFNFGFEANLAPVFAGYEDSNSTSTTSTYFLDYNGDELVDIVHGGKVYFNHLGPDGEPTFTLNSGDTPSPIQSGAAPDPDLVTVDPEEQEELIDSAPLHDVVRSWTAPYVGNVTIGGGVALVPGEENARADGVIVSVQSGGDVRWRQSIPAGDYRPRTPLNVSSIPVRAGQRIYFRVQSVFNGANDRVEWDPLIYYENQDTSLLDANGLPVYRFRASEDFLLASCQTVRMPVNGTVALTGGFTKPFTTDTLIVESLRIRGDRTTLLRSDTFPPDSLTDEVPLGLPSVRVTDEDDLKFRIQSRSDIDWTAIQWTPTIVYTAADDGSAVVSTTGEPLYRYRPAIDYGMQARVEQAGEVWAAAANDSYTVAVTNLPTWSPLDRGVLTISVKSRDSLYAQRSVQVQIVGEAVQLSLSTVTADSLFVEVDCTSSERSLIGVVATAATPGGATVPLRVFAGRQLSEREMHFGNGYRGWGQFVYNGNRGRATAPIDESLLRPSEVEVDSSDLEDFEDIDPDDPDAFDGLDDIGSDPSTEPFVIMIADPGAGSWRGYDDRTCVGPDWLSSSRLGEDDILLTPDFGSGAGAPGTIVKTRVHAVAGGLSAGPGSLGVTSAWATTTNVLDVMDMNGDRYPDLVTPTRIQYTGPYGGLEGTSLQHSMASHEAKSWAKGLTAGGGFAHSSAQNAGGNSGRGSRRSSRRASTTSKNNNSKAQSGNESAEGSASISGNFSEDLDHTEHSWQDVNGDGLEDKVWRNGDVAMNYGYRFGARENWGFDEIRSGVSYDYGAGVGINVSNNSISAGVGVSRTDNWSRAFLQDVNGDGLADRLRYDEDNNRMLVNLNHGTGFGSTLVWQTDAGRPDSGDASAESANGAFTVCINIIFVRVCVNPSTSAGRSVSRVLTQYNDIDGDGIADALSSRQDDRLTVRRSRLGRTNLLRSITGPLGAQTIVDYERAPTGFDMPFAKWVMKEVTIEDGLSGDGPDRRKVAFSYDGPVYDRDERDFLGFREVRSTELDTENDDRPYRSSVTEYALTTYYDTYLPRREYREDGEGRPFGTVEYTYELLDPETLEPANPATIAEAGARLFPALTSMTEYFQEGEADDAISERTEYTYGAYGNVTKTIATGNGRPEDLQEVINTYHPVGQRYITGAKATSDIYGGGELLRRMETRINAQGDEVLLRRSIDANTVADTETGYDDYGNVIRETRPATATGERHTMTYTYDDTLHTYLTGHTDGYGLTATYAYDLVYGAKTEVTNVHGYRTEIVLDKHGRATQVRLPLDSVYSYRYTYYPGADVPYATAERYNPDTGEGLMSYHFTDYLGRPVQHKQEAVVGETEALSLVVSGKVIFDAFDRPVAEYYPTTEGLASGSRYTPAPASAPPSRTAYDVLNRPKEQVTSFGITRSLSYDIAPLPGGERMLRKTLTDGRGNRTASYMTGGGQLEAHRTERARGDIWMIKRFNALGDLVSVTDEAGCATTYAYDLMGRIVEKSPCNAGPTRYELDPAGLLQRKITPNLATLNPTDPPAIAYTYELERLVRIDYPKNYQNRVELTYGEADAPHHRAGRIWMTKDASGGRELFFDANGNVTKSIRTLLINEASLRTYVTEAAFDSWGRMHRLIYPDGEEVSYTFNADGRPRAMSGQRDGIDYAYVDAIHYDGFNRISGTTFGNGIRQEYTFDPLSRRLSSQSVGNLLQLNYLLDENGNPTHIETEGGGAQVPSGRQTFDYDENDQLTEASGDWSGGGTEESYTYFVDYDRNFNAATQDLQRFSGADTLARRFEYTFDPGHSNRLAATGNREYTYDANGNQLGYRDTSAAGSYLNYRWDEEDRLMAFQRDGRGRQYTYAADGRRAIESSARRSGVFTFGAPTGMIDHGSDYTAYVNDFFTARKDGFTKHYFLGGHRIASKEGTGEFNNYYWFGRGLTAGDENYVARIQDLTRTVWDYYGAAGVPPGPPTLPGFYAQPEFTGRGLPQAPVANYASPPAGWPGPIGPPSVTGPPGAPTYFPPQTPRDSIGAGYGFTGYAAFPETELTYYHADMLGSVHLTTDREGELRQYNAYLPTGERAIVSTQAEEASPYSFNGKKTEDAAGLLHYFGARYYDAETGVFISQDPLAEEFPGFNPYALGLNNPVAYGDPDGRKPEQHFDSPQAAARDFGKIYNKKSIRYNREFGAYIYRVDLAGGSSYYTYDVPLMGGTSGVNPIDRSRGNRTAVADVHTHGMMMEQAPSYTEFSDGDLAAYAELGENWTAYVIVPDGKQIEANRVRRRSTASGETFAADIRVVATDLPYDKEWFDNPRDSHGRHRALTRSQEDARVKRARKHRNRAIKTQLALPEHERAFITNERVKTRKKKVRQKR
jgi:RHS repeat-associated protein